MTISTFGELLNELPEWLERGDLDARLPTFVRLAESRINRELRVAQMIVRSSASIAGEFRARPPDFLAPRSMRLAGGSRRLLAFLTPEQMADLKHANPGAGGELVAYCLSGAEFEFSAAPAAPVDVVLTYYAKIPALEQNGTNWLLQAHPDVYLHASILEAAVYLRDGELALGAKALFDEAKAAVAAMSVGDQLAANLSPQPSGFAV